MRTHVRHHALHILLDHNVPKPLRRILRGHLVQTAYEMTWAALRNGELLAAAQWARFDLLITADQNLTYQQNLSDRVISLIVLGSAQWPYLLPHRPRILEEVERAVPGSYAFIKVLLPSRQPRAAS